MIIDFNKCSFDISSVYMVDNLNFNHRKYPTYFIYFDSGKSLLMCHEKVIELTTQEPIMNRDEFIRLWKKCRPKKIKLL